MRLIDADELKENLNAITDDETCPIHIAAEVDQCIDYASTIEAEPVKHGRWIITPIGMGRNINTGKMSYSYNCDCNICGFHTGNQGLKFHYCPNCGAKMDGVPDNSKEDEYE